MCEIHAASEEELLAVVKQCRDQDKHEISSLRWGDWSTEEILETRYKFNGPMWCAVFHGSPIAVFGADLVMPGVIVLWIIATEEVFKVAKSIIRFCKRTMKDALNNGLVRRIQATIHSENRKAIRFAELCGMKFEGVLRETTRDGKDMCMYSTIASDL